MKVVTREITFNTRGDNDMRDLTGEAAKIISSEDVKDGIATIFVVGSTAGVTTIEFEGGLRKDFPELMDKLIPKGRYHHDASWGEGNGHSHLRASLIGSSLVVPFANKSLVLGTWQQIVFIDFDNRPRQRKVVIQLLGS